MSIRKNTPSRRLVGASLRLAALGALILAGLLPAFAQQPPPDPSDPPPRTAKPAKKVITPTAKPDLPAIGAPSIKQKAASDKPKVKRPFGELEGWSSSADAEKKVLPTPRDQSSSGLDKPPIGFNKSGNLGMGIGF